MRLFSWFGAAALATAAGIGYVAGVSHRPTIDQSCPTMPSHEEEASAPPGLAFDWRKPFVEEIDLTCPPNLFWNFDLNAQTGEPPFAQPGQLDPGIRQTSFELPAGDGPELRPFMPYCDDEPEASTTPARPRSLTRAIMEMRRRLHDDQ